MSSLVAAQFSKQWESKYNKYTKSQTIYDGLGQIISDPLMKRAHIFTFRY